MVTTSAPKYRESGWLRIGAFGRHWWSFHLCTLNWIVSQNWISPRHIPRCTRWHREMAEDWRQTAMVNQDPRWPLRSVGELLGTGRLPNKLAKALSPWLWIIKKYRGDLSMKVRSGQGIHTFLGHLAYGVDPFPGFLGLLSWPSTGAEQWTLCTRSVIRPIGHLINQ